MDGLDTLGTITLDDTGTAIFSTNALAVGDHPDITAVYSGDDNYNGSTSPDYDQQVSQATTITALTSSANPSAVGQPVTFTATVTPIMSGPASPTGTVTFTDNFMSSITTLNPGGTPLGADGTAAFSTSGLTAGDHVITADYSGNGNYSGSGDTLTQTITDLPDIVMDMATTTDHLTVTATYDITGVNVDQPLSFAIYRSASAASYAPSDQIGVDTLPASDTADLLVGHHQVQLDLYTPNLLPDPSHEFVFVVANSGDTVQEQDYTNDTAYFQIFVLGAVSHGYVPPTEDTDGQTPDWELEMAAALQKIDGYNYVIPFNWVLLSRTKQSDEAVFAGAMLANQVAAEVVSLEKQHSGDVVDYHFIGHSRGSVVISQAIADMIKLYPSFINGNYVNMTMLDPHPARNYPKPTVYFSAARNPVAFTLKKLYLSFQKVADDPMVVVPSVVTSVQDFFQHTPFNKFPCRIQKGNLICGGREMMEA